MPIKPIDLQMLFMQLDKLGRDQKAVKENAVVQQAVHGAVAQKRALEEAKSVKKPETPGDGAEAVRADGRQDRAQDDGEEMGREKTSEEKGPDGSEVIKDPKLGTHVDVSG